MSKGSTPRPLSVPHSEFANNFDTIFRKPNVSIIEDDTTEVEEEVLTQLNAILELQAVLNADNS